MLFLDLFYICGTPVLLRNLLKQDAKSRSSGAGFEPAAYGFVEQESENSKMY